MQRDHRRACVEVVAGRPRHRPNVDLPGRVERRDQRDAHPARNQGARHPSTIARRPSISTASPRPAARSAIAPEIHNRSIVDRLTFGGNVIDHQLPTRPWPTTYHDLPLGAVDASVLAAGERTGDHHIAILDRRHFAVILAGGNKSLRLYR